MWRRGSRGAAREAQAAGDVLGVPCASSPGDYSGPGVLPRHLHVSLIAAHAVGFATLVRSVAFDRWITVLASLLLVVGATAALRGRTWGVVLAFASAVAFPVAWAIGIAPLWFVVVGVFGALPYLMVSGALAQVDRKAASSLTAIAWSVGALAAVGWKAFAWDVFAAFPSLTPSVFPQHGLAVLALMVAGMFSVVVASRAPRRGDGARIAADDPARLRVALDSSEPAARDPGEEEGEAEAMDEARTTRRRQR